MSIKNSVYIINKQLNWYGHVQIMNEERLPRKIFEWYPPGRRRKGRPQISWMQEVTTGMRENGINNLVCVDREGWGKKIKIKILAKDICENI